MRGRPRWALRPDSLLVTALAIPSTAAVLMGVAGVLTWWAGR